MSVTVAIGERRSLAGFALAGVDIRAAEDARGVHEAWNSVGQDVGLVILTPRAKAVLETRLSEREEVIWVSLPG